MTLTMQVLQKLAANHGVPGRFISGVELAG
jgi:hypothetical protein